MVWNEKGRRDNGIRKVHGKVSNHVSKGAMPGECGRELMTACRLTMRQSEVQPRPPRVQTLRDEIESARPEWIHQNSVRTGESSTNNDIWYLTPSTSVYIACIQLAGQAMPETKSRPPRPGTDGLFWMVEDVMSTLLLIGAKKHVVVAASDHNWGRLANRNLLLNPRLPVSTGHRYANRLTPLPKLNIHTLFLLLPLDGMKTIAHKDPNRIGLANGCCWSRRSGRQARMHACDDDALGRGQIRDMSSRDENGLMEIPEDASLVPPPHIFMRLSSDLHRQLCLLPYWLLWVRPRRASGPGCLRAHFEPSRGRRTCRGYLS